MVIDVGALYEQEYPAIYRFVRRRVDDDATAEDLAADVFVRVVQAIDGYEERGVPPGAWLSRIARNLLTDHYRRQAVARRHASISLHSATQDAGSDDHAAQLRVAEALMKLPSQQRLALIEWYLMDAPTEDTAQVLGCTPNNVCKLRMRAHVRLREILGTA